MCLGWGAGEVSPIKSSSITRCALFARQRLFLLQSKSGPAGNRPETAGGGEAGMQGERQPRARPATPHWLTGSPQPGQHAAAPGRKEIPACHLLTPWPALLRASLALGPLRVPSAHLTCWPQPQPLTLSDSAPPEPPHLLLAQGTPLNAALTSPHQGPNSSLKTGQEKSQ